MKKRKVTNTIAKGVTKVLDTVLKIDANSTSCIVSYQPKAPKKLERYRSTK